MLNLDWFMINYLHKIYFAADAEHVNQTTMHRLVLSFIILRLIGSKIIMFYANSQQFSCDYHAIILSIISFYQR